MVVWMQHLAKSLVVTSCAVLPQSCFIRAAARTLLSQTTLFSNLKSLSPQGVADVLAGWHYYFLPDPHQLQFRAQEAGCWVGVLQATTVPRPTET